VYGCPSDVCRFTCPTAVVCRYTCRLCKCTIITAELFDKLASVSQRTNCACDILQIWCFTCEALYNTHTLSRTMCTRVTWLYNYRQHTHKDDFLVYYPIYSSSESIENTRHNIHRSASSCRYLRWHWTECILAMKCKLCRCNNMTVMQISGIFRFTIHLCACGTQCQQAADSYADCKMSFIKCLAVIAWGAYVPLQQHLAALPHPARWDEVCSRVSSLQRLSARDFCSKEACSSVVSCLV